MLAARAALYSAQSTGLVVRCNLARRIGWIETPETKPGPLPEILKPPLLFTGDGPVGD
ncbi:hypothetical protein [Bradyrhizobium sp. Ai1a-2]|uniref:hypothetical protein n=1 Tax=Bradyrhizobium sp. Ai1a-2 TaxID=196490 RepID=UPI000408726D|nr:hypothetical protein [Bradyrhizobium sp. Ai1a-2]